MEYNKKEELFDKISGLKITNPNIKETWFNWGVNDSYERVELFFDKELVPEVPQYVANWYEKHKNNFNFHVWDYVYMFDSKDESDFTRWLNDSSVDSFQTLVNMHQFGYKVKKDKKYLVKLKGVLNGTKALKHNIREDSWYMGTVQESLDLKMFHTKEELKAGGFEGVFNNPMFEVEEVVE